tara:strand:- start:1806 stop:2213 length:408 start_codon:yes stop_codon:yes gene_type:complete
MNVFKMIQEDGVEETQKLLNYTSLKMYNTFTDLFDQGKFEEALEQSYLIGIRLVDLRNQLLGGMILGDYMRCLPKGRFAAVRESVHMCGYYHDLTLKALRQKAVEQLRAQRQSISIEVVKDVPKEVCEEHEPVEH